MFKANCPCQPPLAVPLTPPSTRISSHKSLGYLFINFAIYFDELFVSPLENRNVACLSLLLPPLPLLPSSATYTMQRRKLNNAGLHCFYCCCCCSRSASPCFIPCRRGKKEPKPKLIHSVQTETNAIFVVLIHENFGQKINIFFKLKKCI